MRQEGPAGLERREGSSSIEIRAGRLPDDRACGSEGQRVKVTGIEVQRAGQPLTPHLREHSGVRV